MRYTYVCIHIENTNNHIYSYVCIYNLLNICIYINIWVKETKNREVENQIMVKNKVTARRDPLPAVCYMRFSEFLYQIVFFLFYFGFSISFFFIFVSNVMKNHVKSKTEFENIKIWFIFIHIHIYVELKPIWTNWQRAKGDNYSNIVLYIYMCVNSRINTKGHA